MNKPGYARRSANYIKEIYGLIEKTPHNFTDTVYKVKKILTSEMLIKLFIFNKLSKNV